MSKVMKGDKGQRQRKEEGEQRHRQRQRCEDKEAHARSEKTLIMNSADTSIG